MVSILYDISMLDFRVQEGEHGNERGLHVLCVLGRRLDQTDLEGRQVVEDVDPVLLHELFIVVIF